MKRLMTAIMVLSLVLGGVALAAAADSPQDPKSLDLNKLQKISDQEAQQLRGTGMSFGAGICLNTCTAIPNNNSNSYGSGLIPKLINHNYGGNNPK
jgi:hypothetical protein